MVQRQFAVVTDGATIQVQVNELSYLELKALFAMLDAAIDAGRFPAPSSELAVVERAPAEEDKKE